MENIYISDFGELTTILDWNYAGIFPEFSSSMIPELLRGSDVYSISSSLEGYGESEREQLTERTELRDLYILHT